MNKMDKGMSGESIFLSIVENQADLICRFEPDGKLLYANRSFAEYINCHQDELVGKNLFDELDPGMRQVFLNATHALDLTHPVQSSEYSEESACKEKAWRQWNHKGIFGENGKLIEIQSVGHNITEQKRLEIAAAQRNIELHALH